MGSWVSEGEASCALHEKRFVAVRATLWEASAEQICEGTVVRAGMRRMDCRRAVRRA